MSRFIDVHAEKRKELKLFQAVEPKVDLIGITEMLRTGNFNHLGDDDYEAPVTDFVAPNEIPGFVARKSHGSTGTAADDEKLTKKLLAFNPAHKTPFEFMVWVFDITGVSKSCLTQFDRNRVGIGFVQMSGRFMDSSERGFVYTAFAEMPWEDKETFSARSASLCLQHEQKHFSDCLQAYEDARGCGQTKQDARKKLPLAMASGTYVYLNSSSLKTWFNERLRPATEWEHRRLAQMVFDIVYSIAPTHFEQEKELLDGKNS